MLSDCHPLGAILYRKWHVYDMTWGDNKRLDNYIVSGAPFGGPIAMIPDNRNRSTSNEMKEKLTICTSSGGNIAQIEWNDKQVIGMGWTDQENLVTVTDEGGVKVFSLNGNLINEFSLLGKSTQTKLFIECHFWGSGVAVMTSESIVYVAEGLCSSDFVVKGPRLYKLRTGLGLDRSCTCMAIVPPLLSKTGMLEVLVGTSDNSVLVVYEGVTADNNEIQDQLLSSKIDAPIVKIAVAPNGQYLACYRHDGILTVMSSAFTTKVLDFDAKSVSGPIDIVWCGEDSVVMQWRNTGIVMVGPFGDWLNFPYNENDSVHLIAEPDCCRIITSSGSCDILQRVPATTVAIRSVGSTDPAALMFDAMEAFEEGDPKSDENIRSIAAAHQLGDAVSACIRAAAGEFDVGWQQSFLKAASYGKAFCPDADPTEFVETAKKLRVLNEVRKPNIGIPLTMQQYNRLTPEVLVNRLTVRNHHFLALRICELLRLRTDRVLIHWSCAKIRSMAAAASSSTAGQATAAAVSDEEMMNVLRKQLEGYNKISYLSIAETAYSVGRRRLATFILDREQDPRDQIPLLMKMKEDDLALRKAIGSEDIDLIYYTLISLEARMVQQQQARNSNSSSSNNSINASNSPVESFYRIIHNYPEAVNLLKIFYRSRVVSDDRLKLHQLLMYNRNYQEAGIAAANQAFQQSVPANKVQLLREASQLFAQSKDAGFLRTMTDEQVDLLELQHTLDKRSSTASSSSSCSFIGLGVMETIQQLILLGIAEPLDARWMEQEIGKIVKKFKVSEKALWHMKVQCYSSNGQWELLARLAQEKKSPIGYRPFARACIDYNQSETDIEQYIERIPALEDRYDMYFLETKSYRKATEVAAKLRDPNKLQEIGRACKDPTLERQIQDILARM